MTLSTETLTALSALGSRILPLAESQMTDPRMVAIYNDLSIVERVTLSLIVKTERQGEELHLEPKQVTALTLLQERLYDKHQTDPFVVTELRALAECTGIHRSPVANDAAHYGADESANTAANEPHTESDDEGWNNPNPWFRVGN
ncbi:hypothetical protein [Marinobacter daqiaonensis]|nr:hypothetical protein [Marinobacter daqiaonensis]